VKNIVENEYICAKKQGQEKNQSDFFYAKKSKLIQAMQHFCV
jgi:hypothetical protein